ncbi:uncharacterized protein LOC125663627 [Ostrea edulis]|uniref:uncharacterized protein LOC125663627 n=1 Tax=Ostrea edulis TaxID=37623 RepID=UPI0024AEAF2D|nr:uncharacterized protein LOC125663627 [Ostrea edulis]
MSATEMNMKSVVNSLYQFDETMNKRKTIEIKRVMRGALSTSRSTTGDNTFHINKFANKGLEQQIRVLDKAKIQCRNGINSKKRTALRKWCLVFGKQKSMNDSIKELNEVITKAIEEDGFLESRMNPEDEEKVEEEQIEELENNTEPEPVDKRSGMDPSQIRALMIKQQRGGIEIKTNEQGITSMLLPKIDFGNTNMKLENVELDPETPQAQEDIWPLKDTTWVSSYIKDQREKHDQLFTKNILKSIQIGMTKTNPLHSFRLRAKISDDPMDLLRQLTSAKTARPSTRDPLRRSAQTAGALQSHREVLTARSQISRGTETQIKLPPLIRSKTMFP